ncbi:MAG: hypothetical protein K8F58_13810 [Bauldia sp.]|nr:hypothetical protein [Bauldia sp.]
MDLTFSILLVLHLTALVVGGATNVAMPLLGRQMAGAPPEALGRLGPIARQLGINSRAALAVLVVTGLAMLWLRYGGDAAGLGPWFVAKLVFIALILVALLVGLVARPGTLDPRIFALVTRVALFGIIASSVMTFG